MSLSKSFKIHYWPIVGSSCIFLTFVVTYVISVLHGHVPAFFPFISDTGTKPPESCIFAQMMNIGGAMIAINMYIRYRQVKFAMDSNCIILQKMWNKAAFWSGLGAGLGLSIIGNFQETNVLVNHLVGSLMIFISGAINLISNTKITFAFKNFYRRHPKYGIGSSLVYIVFSFISVVSCYFSLQEFTGDDFVRWSPQDGGFLARLISTFSACSYCNT